MIVKFDHKNRKVQVSLKGENICNSLQEKKQKSGKK